VNFQISPSPEPGNDIKMKAHYVKNDHIVSPKGLRGSYTKGKFQKYQNLNEARRLS
jgi:hypothetical protein